MDDYYREARDAALFKPKSQPESGRGRPFVSTSETEGQTVLKDSDELDLISEDEGQLSPEQLAAHWKELHPSTEEDDDEEGDDDE